VTRTKQAVGAWGERLAARHLLAAGYRIEARNWRCPAGEVDIIAWQGDTLVFCEVKTRRGAGYGSPADAVVFTKARRLRRLAAIWLSTNDLHVRDVRFDVVSVLLLPQGRPEIDHIEAAF
jgi:putative endonuclease